MPLVRHTVRALQRPVAALMSGDHFTVTSRMNFWPW